MSLGDHEVELIARICHEANRTYCVGIGDLSQVPWGQAPDWQRASAIAGVRHHLADDLTPEQSHAKWFAHKYDEGWQWGPVKDEQKKLHPCMLPYEHLPEFQKRKDLLFRNIVKAFKEST